VESSAAPNTPAKDIPDNNLKVAPAPKS
jgi:hypothetical protein